MAAAQPSTSAMLLGVARAIPAIGLAILFGAMAYIVRGNGGREVDWFGPAALAFLCGIGAVSIIIRALLKHSSPKAKREIAVESEPEFDADAAIKRYMANRGDRPAPAEAAPETPAPRPVFGRKINS